MTTETQTRPSGGYSRRRFIAGAGAGTTALAFNLVRPAAVRGASANGALAVGLIGCGGRGAWIAD